MSTGNPPAGYYADPSVPGYIRYWDGEAWVAGTSRPAPEEVAEQVLASSQGGAQAGGAQQDAQADGDVAAQSAANAVRDSAQSSASAAQSSGTWQPEPTAASAQVPQQGRHTRDQPQQYSGGQGGQSRQYAGGQAGQAPQPFAGGPGNQVQQPFVGGQASQAPQPITGGPGNQVQQPFAGGQASQAQPPQAGGQASQAPQPFAGSQNGRSQQQYAGVPQPQQFAPTPASAPSHAPAPMPTPTPGTGPAPAPQREPESAAAMPQAPESVATMIVPSAFGARVGGGYGYAGIGGGAGNPFAGLPGMEFAVAEDAEEPEASVVELASPGSRILARIIDLGIAAVFSAPITITLLLIAHRHDHQYVLKLDAEATTTYTTLGMDGVGIGLWAGALAALVLASIVYEGYRLGRSGQTLGKKLAGVRVVRMPGGEALGRGGGGTRRALFFWVLAVIPVVDVLALGGVFWGRPYRQGAHEKATSTATIKA